ncbi:hypothetical protein WN944_017829 [Citrus x changshan-huyou]|uniref:ATP synthase F1 complex delta/epsilon subunit N-terminal domain-containing protein n=1 Tax=Citrus x changshan-huyou TaxID=2935761 RepID=A0AAP0MEH6_9ROSI
MGLQIQSNAEIAEELGLGHFRSPLAKSGFVFFRLRKVIDKIIIPSTTGLMSVLPGHASIIAVLKSGVLSVHEGNEKGLAEFTQKLSLASTNLEKAEAQIGVDVHVALNSALTGKC